MEKASQKNFMKLHKYNKLHEKDMISDFLYRKNDMTRIFP